MKDQLFWLSRVFGVPATLRHLKGEGITVLNLHRISEEQDFFFEPIRPKVFEQLIQYCLKHYDVVSFADVIKKTRRRKILLSFDDGYHDFMEFALPVLTRYSLPSNHNLVNACLNGQEVIWTQRLNDIFTKLKTNGITDDALINRIGLTFRDCSYNWMSYYVACLTGMLKLKLAERSTILGELATKYGVSNSYRMMSWEDARHCAEKCDVEIGCHSYQHDSLATLYSNEELNREIGASIREMELKLGRKVTIFAAPNGGYNQQVLDYSRQSGIRFFLLADGHINQPSQLDQSFNLVSRVGLINESIAETIHRSELFHYRLRRE